MKHKIGLIALLFLAACKPQPNNTNGPATIESKLAELAELKKQQDDISSKITEVEGELLIMDPSRGVKPKLVSTMTLTPEGFQYYIDLQGSISSSTTSYVAPRNGMGGYVKQLFVKAGQYVKKGQIVLKLDDQVLRQSIESTKTQLALTRNLYERTKSLWDQNIGTEVQVLTAKANMETLENQLKTQEEQLKTYVVYADQAGIADIVNVRAGELFTGMGPTGPQIQIVNNNDLSAKVDIPENYTWQVKQGARVKVEVPAVKKSFETTVTRISQSINAASRGFTAECKLPSSPELKPNMAASVKILNHSNPKAMVIPVNLVQSDEKGKYIYIMKEAEGKKVASRRQVTLGHLYGEDIEIVSGLASGDNVIIQGYQNLYEGQVVENVIK